MSNAGMRRVIGRRAFRLVAVGAALSAVAVGLALLFATATGGRRSGNEAAASSAAAKCQTTHPGTPSTSADAPPADTIGALAVLRRPAAPTDTLPQTPIGAQQTRLLGESGLGTIDSSYVRLAGQTPEGNHLYLVPGVLRSPSLDPKCLRTLTPRARRLARRRAQRAKPQPALCLADYDTTELFPLCWPAAKLGAGQILGITFPLTSANAPETASLVLTVVGVVPDGVASIEAAYPKGDTVTASVSGNFFSFNHRFVPRVKLPHLPNVFPETITLKSAAGAVIATSKPSGLALGATAH